MSRRRVCLDCPAIIPTTAYRGRCPACNRQRDQARGSRQERGYDAEHDRLRRQYQRRLDVGEVIPCARCGQPVTPPWHLDHKHPAAAEFADEQR